jgi:hypothetical protein
VPNIQHEVQRAREAMQHQQPPLQRLKSSRGTFWRVQEATRLQPRAQTPKEQQRRGFTTAMSKTARNCSAQHKQLTQEGVSKAKSHLCQR